MSKNLLNIQELSLVVGTSIQTIGSWYRWKELNPTHELAKKLPNFVRIGAHRTRYWNVEDVEKVMDFKNSIPQGRGGIMGAVTQKYVKKDNKPKRSAKKDA